MAVSLEVIQARVRRIPPGFVTTYADLCPGAPRLAGRALSLGPADLPWWRVVHSDGTCESDGLHWPRRDGLKWLHLASVACWC